MILANRKPRFNLNMRIILQNLNLNFFTQPSLFYYLIFLKFKYYLIYCYNNLFIIILYIIYI